MVTVKISGLARKWADDTSVGPIDLFIHDGELMTLLGPSGAGKTTILRMLAGFIEPDAGSLSFNERDMMSVHPREREIGMVFQSIALFPHMTVFQNIAFGPEMAGWDHQEVVKRVEELADMLGIRRLLHRRIGEISGGEAQRVAIARALAKEPKLLLLDEPLSSLDPQLRERLQAEIRKLQKTVGITTIYVTHDQDEAFAISDSVAVLKDGLILQVGSPAELYNKPSTEFVAQFIGEGNVFRGDVIDVSEKEIIVNVSGHSFQVKGESEIGKRVCFTVKPESIDLTSNETEKGVKARVISIVPQAARIKYTLDFDGNNIIVISNREKKSSKKINIESEVVFRFEPENAILLTCFDIG
jgi:ABC-type Fe3+/spermidine/putrescine transport system ATPase subunit